MNFEISEAGNILKKNGGFTQTVYSPGDNVDIRLSDGTVIEGMIEYVNVSKEGLYINGYFYRLEDIEDMMYSTYTIKDKEDMVNHPGHYISETGLETIDVIEAFTFDLKGIEATDTGNVLKYMCRWKSKNGLEDLKKAQWYLNHLINHVEKLEKENDNYEENRNCKRI